MSEFHVVKGTKSIREGHVDDRYRFTSEADGDCCVLRKVGSHDLIKKPQRVDGDY